jgi:hypothetical protein
MARPKSTNVVLDYILTPNGGAEYIDLFQGLSVLNRRMFRQGYVLSVDFIEYIGNSGAEISIVKIPEGYTTHRAHEFVYRLWKSQRAEALENLDTLSPGKWSDFKVYMEAAHESVGQGLLPSGASSGGTVLNQVAAYGNAEWNYADIVYHDPALPGTSNQLDIQMLGSNDLPNGRAACIDTWGEVRLRTHNPDPLNPLDASTSWAVWTGENSADQTSQVIDLIEDENDSPPYGNQPDTTLNAILVGANSLPGGVLVDTAVTGTTGRPVALDGGLIPCGLLKVTVGQAEVVTHSTLRVHCTRGEYKGVAALPMGDFR